MIFLNFLKLDNENIVVCILNRPRHVELMNQVRSTGARIKFIPDGDVSAVIATSIDDSGIDLIYGNRRVTRRCFSSSSLKML